MIMWVPLLVKRCLVCPYLGQRYTGNKLIDECNYNSPEELDEVEEVPDNCPMHKDWLLEKEELK